MDTDMPKRIQILVGKRAEDGTPQSGFWATEDYLDKSDHDPRFCFVHHSLLTEARELLEACKKKAEFDGAYAGGCSCGLCQEWRELINRISIFVEKVNL